MNKSNSILFATILLFTACASDNLKLKNKTVEKQQTQSGEPLWLDNPYVDKDEFAAVGCARRNFKGKVVQRKKAESIALDGIARQIKTTVSNKTLRENKHYNGREIYSKVDSISAQSVDNISLSTKIKASYTQDNGNICVWMVLR